MSSYLPGTPAGSSPEGYFPDASGGSPPVSGSYNPFNQFVADLANKVHNLGVDALKIALSNTQPLNTNTVLADIAEISYVHCSSRSLDVTSSRQSSGLYKLIVSPLTLTASGGTVGPFQYLVIYNSTPAGSPLIAWIYCGTSITLNDSESLPIIFDAENGLIDLQVAQPAANALDSILGAIVIGSAAYVLSAGELRRMTINPKWLSIKQDLAKIWEQS